MSIRSRLFGQPGAVRLSHSGPAQPPQTPSAAGTTPTVANPLVQPSARPFLRWPGQHDGANGINSVNTQNFTQPQRRGTTPPSVEEKQQRLQQLTELKAAQSRPLDAQKAIDAIKLRKFAEAHYQKKMWSRVTHKMPLTRPVKGQLDALKEMDVDTLIGRIKSGRLRCNRTLLTDVAKHHLVAALNFDIKAYEQGVRHMAAWEGVHSTVGRAVSFAGSLVSFRAAPAVAGLGTAAANAAGKAMKILSHQLPTVLINPMLTGLLRITTDIRKSGRNGGISKVAKNIENASALRDIRANMERESNALRGLLLNRYTRSNVIRAPNGKAYFTQKFIGEVCHAFINTYEAQAAYKERIGSAKTHTWSKGCGMGVNALASSAQALGIAFPPAIPASLAIQGCCIPLQFGAGYADMHTAQRYNFRANVKYGRVLTKEAQHLAIEKLHAEHIDTARLRDFFQPAQVQKVELIREVYKDDLAELHFKKNKIEQELRSLTSSSGAKRGAKIIEKRAELAQLGRQIAQRESDVGKFESFSENGWGDLPADSTIGRCLNDHNFLIKHAEAARKRKPGEIAVQVWQRYKQLYGSGPAATGVIMPLMDMSLNLDHSLAGHFHSQRPLGDSLGAGVGGATSVATFTAATGVVRTGKASDKRALAKAMKESKVAQREALRAEWAVPVGDGQKKIDLSDTGAFDRTLHSRTERVIRFVKIMPHGLLSSERALYHTIRARKTRKQTHETLAEALNVLHYELRSSPYNLKKNTPAARLKEDFLALPGVSAKLAAKGR